MTVQNRRPLKVAYNPGARLRMTPVARSPFDNVGDDYGITGTIRPFATFQGLGCGNSQGRGIGRLGDTKLGIQGAAAGAKVGSVVPLIGTAIGAVVGGVAGLLVHTGKKPQRAADAAAIMQQLAALPYTTSGSAIPWANFGPIWYGLIINGGLYSWAKGNIMNHPSAMDAEYEDVIAVTKEGIKQAIAAGLGRSVTLNLTSTRGAKFSVPVTVPNNVTESAWNAAITIPIFVARCAAYNAIASCSGDVERVPQFKKFMQLLTGRILADNASALQSMALNASRTTTPVVITRPTTAASTPLTVTGQTTAGTPIVPVDQTGQLVQALIAQGATQQSALQQALASLQAQGVNTNNAAIQQQLAADVSGRAYTSTGAQTAGISSGILSSIPVWVWPLLALGFAVPIIIKKR